MKKFKETVGISSSVPIEVVYASGRSVLDLNNCFIGDADREELLADAEKSAFPRTTCVWTKGVYAGALKHGLKKVIIVTRGDCSNSQVIGELLQLRNVEVIPFSYPYEQNKDRLRQEIDTLIGRMKTSWKAAGEIKRDLDAIRSLVRRIDTMTWEDNVIGGFENHYYLVSASDMMGDPAGYRQRLSQFLESVKGRRGYREKIRVGYVGVPPVVPDLYRLIEDMDGRVVFNETQRQFAMLPESGDLVEQYRQYTYPYSIYTRIEDIRQEIHKRGIECLIHYVQSFCFHQAEDTILRERLRIPILTLEADRPGAVDARVLSRLESFLRPSGSRLKGRYIRKTSCLRRKKAGVPVMGIDVGSREVKIVFETPKARSTMYRYSTVNFYKRFCRRGPSGRGIELDDLFLHWGFCPKELHEKGLKLVATGYGRYTITMDEASIISEPLAHVYGAVSQTGLTDFILLDIGGQDVKIVSVKGGELERFAMNDKCAAGSGRYLENMARVLGVSLQELSRHCQDPVALDSTCATFGETELVARIIEGSSTSALCAGVNRALVKRIVSQLASFSGEILVVTGGGAKNPAVLALLEEMTGFTVRVPRFPQYNGALGCAVAG